MIIFNSYQYILFLIIVVTAYWFLPRIWQNVLLLGASYFFYATWDWRYLSIIFFLTLSNFFIGNKIFSESDNRIRKNYAILAIGINLITLGFFKYYNFFLDSLDVFLSVFNLSVASLHLSIILPLGISFYTLQKIAYIYDLYKGKIKPADTLLTFALFSCFFPQLVAGPIEKPSHLLPQIENNRSWNTNNLTNGCDLIIWGLLKKVFIADNIAYYVNIIFALNEPSTLLILVGTFAFGFQILADFSGYSDIAMGSAKLLGIDLMRNFNHPYLSRSPRDFWRRWHISLSEWLRDYLYIPLGGSRCSKKRHILNLFITWFICGLWHGAAAKFIVWGLYNGLLVSLSNIRVKSHQLIEKPGLLRIGLSIIFTYIIMNLGWLFFRIDNLSYLLNYFSVSAILKSIDDISVAMIISFIVIFYSIPFLLVDIRKYILTDKFIQRFTMRPYTFYERYNMFMPSKRVVCYCFMILLIITFSSNNSGQFIYFQF